MSGLDGSAELSGDGGVFVQRATKIYPLRFGTWDSRVYQEVVLNDEYGVGRLDDTCRTVIDIGANVGYFTALAATPTRRVFSVEPASATFKMLCKTREINGLDPSGAICRAVTASGEGSLRLYYSASCPSTTSYLSRQELGPVQEETVPTASLADVLSHSGFETVDLLKLDVEGGEYDILLGTPATVFERLRAIVIEFHLWTDNAPTAIEESLARLTSLGFQCHQRPTEPTSQLKLVFAKKG